MLWVITPIFTESYVSNEPPTLRIEFHLLYDEEKETKKVETIYRNNSGVENIINLFYILLYFPFIMFVNHESLQVSIEIMF